MTDECPNLGCAHHKSKVTAIIHGQPREIMGAELTDAQVASGVFMHTSPTMDSILRLRGEGTTRGQALLASMSEVARDRILYLSQQLEAATGHLRNALSEMDREDFTSEAAQKQIEEADAFLDLPRTVPSVELDVMKRA